jgi:hypothetical protein
MPAGASIRATRAASAWCPGRRQSRSPSHSRRRSGQGARGEDVERFPRGRGDAAAPTQQYRPGVRSISPSLRSPVLPARRRTSPRYASDLLPEQWSWCYQSRCCPAGAGDDSCGSDTPRSKSPTFPTRCGTVTAAGEDNLPGVRRRNSGKKPQGSRNRKGRRMPWSMGPDAC